MTRNVKTTILKITTMMTNDILKSLNFEELSIRAILHEDETVVWLCLNDLLKALDRVCMMDSGQAMRICRTSFRVPFKEGGRNRWGVNLMTCITCFGLSERKTVR